MMAPFTPGISPYAYCDDDPIDNFDEFGFDTESQHHKKHHPKPRPHPHKPPVNIWHAIVTFFTGRGYDALGHLLPSQTPDGPMWTPQHGSNSSSNQTADREPDDIEPISPNSGTIPNQIDHSIDITFNQEPTYKGNKIPSRGSYSFSEEVYYNPSSDKFYDIDATEKTLSDLLKTMQEFPQLSLLICGNIDGNFNITGHSAPALAQQAWFNGSDSNCGTVMIGRAMAIYRYLIKHGINPQRLIPGAGNVFNAGGSKMKASFELRNP